RQNLSGLLGRMERDGRIQTAQDGRDRRSRLVSMTEAGLHTWQNEALPKIYGYYAQALEGFSINDTTHTLHYLLRLLENMQAVDDRQGGTPDENRQQR
ncbi:MAG: transcriptional regulator, partial [Variovorax sp.]|nr:transcriptional regulator [Variovorax sp.]